MSSTGLAAFEHTVDITNGWLKELDERLGWGADSHRAYHALRAVLHALRDRLPPEGTADLGAQLPMLVRGFYYEGWRPAGKPVKERTKERFLSHIAAAFAGDAYTDPEVVARAVFKLLKARVSDGEIQDVKHNLPHELLYLWE